METISVTIIYFVSQCLSSQTALNLFLVKQVVDLSSNVLTTILPMMVIALERPHLDVDLADNRWQCDYSVAAFQNVISESWRKTWNGICSKSVGKSVVPLLSESFQLNWGKHMKNVTSLEITTVPLKARVLMRALSQPRAAVITGTELLPSVRE